MILLYDAKTRKKLNWNQLQPVTLANVRAINLSKICKKEGFLSNLSHSEDECMRQQLRQRVFQKQRFMGKEIKDLQQTIKKGLQDTTPITQAILRF